jgi:hypothetical protein
MTPRLPLLPGVPRAGSAPRAPWAGLFRDAAQLLTPPEADERDSDVARATCQPWCVWVGTARLRVVYDAPPPLHEAIPE